MQCIPSSAHREIYTVLNGPPSVLLLNRRGRCYGLQTPAHNRQIVGIVLLAKSLFVAVVDSIVAAATCCQNFSSRRRCVHCTYATSIRWKEIHDSDARQKKMFKPPTTSFRMLWASLCCMRSSRPLTNIGPEYAHTENVSARFFLLQFIYSLLHGEMNRDRCRWHRWQPATKEETM